MKRSTSHHPPRSGSPPRCLTRDELDCLRAVPKHPRDQALIEVMVSCGLRVSEACHLRLEQVCTAGEGTHLVLAGKRGQARQIAVAGPALQALETWLDQRGAIASPYVFCALRTGARLSRKTVWAALQRHAAKGGLRPIPPYLLRHALAGGHASVSAPQAWPAPTPSLPTVGRQTELGQLQAFLDRRVDVLLLGPHGAGKSHLLAQLQGERLIRLRRLNPFRPALLTIARALHQAGVLGAPPTTSSVVPAAQPALGETPAPAGPGALVGGPSANPGLPAGAAVSAASAAPARSTRVSGSAGSAPSVQPAGPVHTAPPTASAPPATASPMPAASAADATASPPTTGAACAVPSAAGAPFAAADPQPAIPAAPPHSAPSARSAAFSAPAPTAAAGARAATTAPPDAATSSTGSAPAAPTAAATLPEQSAAPAPAVQAEPARQPDFEAFLRQHRRTPVADWVDLLLQAVRAHEWALVIDDLSGLSPSTGQLLAQLRERFCLVAALPRVPASCRQYLEHCERIPVRNLPRTQARQLVRQHLATIEVEIDDPLLLETRLVYHSGGNPGAMLACLARLRKEPRITRAAIRQVEPGSNAPQIDLTPAILIPVVVLIATRFIARGVGDSELYILAGVGSALVMGAQFFLFRLRGRAA